MKNFYEKPQINTKIKKFFMNIFISIKKTFVPFLILIGSSTCSSLLVSISTETSSKALLEETSMMCANVAKDNSYQKVHFATKMPFKDGIQNRNYNVSMFKKSTEVTHDLFNQYSSAAFLTRNNFYSLPIENDENGGFEYKMISYTFNNETFECVNISAPTYSVVSKKTKCFKIYGNVREEKEIDKMRLETIDLYLCSSAIVSGGSKGYPIYIPDFLAEKIMRTEGENRSFLDCVGLSGTVNINGSIQNVYIKNIIATEEYKNDETLISQVPISSSNSKYASFLKQFYGNFAVFYHTELYAKNQCVSCADFDSEYFKIKNYVSTNLNEVYDSVGSTSYVYSYEKIDDEFVLTRNNSITEKLNNFLKKGTSKPNYFDGNIIFMIFGIALQICSFSYICFYLVKTRDKFNFLDILCLALAPLISFALLSIFDALFMLVFKSNSLFASYIFGSLPISGLIGCGGALVLILLLAFIWKKKVDRNA